MARSCQTCSECCTRMPIRDLDKPANQRCKFQRFHKGCTVYRGPEMPAACQLWNCLWLVGEGTEALSRPDRSGVVLDCQPDFITIRDDDTGATQDVQVVQVWCDPRRPTAHRDPALRAYLERRAAEGIAAIVRYDAREAFVLWAPAFTGGRGWIEQHTDCRREEHTAAQIAAALGPDYVAVNLVTGQIEEETHGKG
jgi:hypothetical protein